MTSNFYSPRIDRFLFTFVLVGCLSWVFIGTPINAGFWLSVNYSAAPAILFIVYAGFTTLKELPVTYKVVRWIMSILLFYPMIVMSAWQYMVAYNAISSRDEVIDITGVITRMYETSGKARSYTIHIKNTKNGETAGINVSKQDFSSMSIGDAYTFCYLNGGLDIPFYWRMKGQPKC